MIPPSTNLLLPDLDSLFATLQTLQTSDPSSYNAIVRPNNPPGGIGGYLFDIPGDEEVSLRSQVTNYFLEDNTSVQDNIALDPPMITLRGMVAELSLGLPAGPSTSLPPTTTNPLIPAMMPVQTPQQQQASLRAATSKATLAAQLSTSLYSYYQAYSSFTPSGSAPSVTKQTNAFLYFKQLWQGQQLVSVETPWGIFEQCAILEVNVVQSEKTRGATDFSVKFQQMRFAGDATVQTGNLAGRTSLQLAPQTKDGNAGQTQITQDMLIQTTGSLTLTPTN